VGIIGAGPAGLVLGHLLQRAGIESVILEKHERSYIEHRVRAGVLEQGTVDLLHHLGVGERMRSEGLRHHGIELRFEGHGHRIDFFELTGRAITIYGQQELIKDLVHSRLQDGASLEFSVEAIGLEGLDTDRPRIRYVTDGKPGALECDFIAGCDGWHGASRAAIPAGALSAFERTYPFAWLGILAEAPPHRDEIAYAHHEHGFALFSMRSPQLTRLYLQVAPDEVIEQWSDDRIWQELHTRLDTRDGAYVNEGPILERSVTPLRSSVLEPMQHHRLYLVGDAAHIVPPTGAKGLNLAVADALVLGRGLVRYFTRGDRERLERYSETCLQRVWRAEHFSWWMTSMLHRFPEHDAFQHRLQLSQLHYITHSRAAATSLAENYVGVVHA
jgi:p-hydroxybenzoate 3-monooxygenase